MKYKKLKEALKITIQEISSESGVNTAIVHGYLSVGKGVKVERVAKIEKAIVTVARERIEIGLKLLEGNDE